MAEIITHHHNIHEVRPIYYGTQVIWFILGVTESLLGLRFILLFLGANPAAAFTDFIYDATYALVAPFSNVFRTARIDTSAGVAVWDWNTLLAMAVYWLVAWAIIRLFFISKPVSNTEADYKLRRDEDL